MDETMSRNYVERKAWGGSELCLAEVCIEGKKEYEMIMNGVFIMASYNYFSAEMLMRKSVEMVKSEDNLKVLIGGLGMGFTVKEACSFPGVAHIDVVEIEPAIAEWNRHYFAEFNRRCMEDERVHIVIDDFFHYVSSTEKRYDIICMDIDNGPMLVVQESNQRVYQVDFFERIKQIMKPGASFGIWSSNYDADLFAGLERAFSNCRVEEVLEEHSNRQLTYYLFFAEKQY